MTKLFIWWSNTRNYWIESRLRRDSCPIVHRHVQWSVLFGWYKCTRFFSQKKLVMHANDRSNSAAPDIKLSGRKEGKQVNMWISLDDLLKKVTLPAHAHVKYIQSWWVLNSFRAERGSLQGKPLKFPHRRKSRITDWQWCCKFGAASSVLYLRYFLVLIIYWSINFFIIKIYVCLYKYMPVSNLHVSQRGKKSCGHAKLRRKGNSHAYETCDFDHVMHIDFYWAMINYLIIVNHEPLKISWTGGRTHRFTPKKSILHFLGRGNF